MNIKSLIVVFYILFVNLCSFGQIIIQMQKDGGVYKIPCIVNGLRLKFVFDTGASNVSISLSEANLMLENGYLDRRDIIGDGKSQIADGSIVNHTKIILREIKISGLVLKDVEAIVINELKAPLLLGLSAIEKLGKIQIQGDEMIVLNAKAKIFSEEEIDNMIKQADSYFNDRLFTAAADTYQELYNQNDLSNYGIYMLADSYYFGNNYKKALLYYLEIKDETIIDTVEDDKNLKFNIYSRIGVCYSRLNEYSEAELFIQKSKLFAISDIQKYFFYTDLMSLYLDTKNCFKMREYVWLSLEYEAKFLDISYNDILTGRSKNQDIGRTLYVYAFSLIDCKITKEGLELMIASARNGNNNAKDYCKYHYINY